MPFVGPLFPVFAYLLSRNGFCYGIADSSIVYYLHPELKPIAKRISDYSWYEAYPSLRTYQSYTLIESIASWTMPWPSYDASAELRTTLASIKEQKRPILHILMERNAPLPRVSHAVVAYKIVDFGDFPQV